MVQAIRLQKVMVLTATGRLVGGGYAVKFVEGELVDSTGTVIATATGVFKRVPENRLAN